MRPAQLLAARPGGVAAAPRLARLRSGPLRRRRHRHRRHRSSSRSRACRAAGAAQGALSAAALRTRHDMRELAKQHLPRCPASAALRAYHAAVLLRQNGSGPGCEAAPTLCGPPGLGGAARSSRVYSGGAIAGVAQECAPPPRRAAPAAPLCAAARAAPARRARAARLAAGAFLVLGAPPCGDARVGSAPRKPTRSGRATPSPPVKQTNPGGTAIQV